MRSLFVALTLLFASAPTYASNTARGAPSDELAEKSAKKRFSDAQIKKLLIEESIAAYAGNCPCPYSRASNGSRCGRRSAYSREGGDAPLCYANDVTPEMVQSYREQHADE